MAKVAFTMENGMKCICSKCPVQGGSPCAQEKIAKMKKTMVADPSQGMAAQMAMPMPAPADVPGLYCSTGKAACTDIDFKQMCICGNCPIWAENKLASGMPMGYFCRDGKSS